uniref:Protein CASC3 n=1 Tax=Phallusia mammillata TaxID=59560 RepID=A0A6F9D8I6_9ASCI|nr:protein CASC3 [Phallusia mammillata]
MAERRRLRPARSDNEEVLSEGESQVPHALSLSQSDGGSEGGYVDLSEYETDEDDYHSQHSSDEEVEAPPEKSPDQFEDAEEDATGVERGSGDGKEQSDSDFEPKKNFVNVSEEAGDPEVNEEGEEEKESPCFIPTKGNFFQHDTRSQDVRGGRTTVRNFRTRPDASRWLHDKFDEREQTPKSREDLIAEYGYDIRAHSYGKPPTNTRGGTRGQRRPFGRHDMNREQHHFRQQNHNANSHNNDYGNGQDWPRLNKERPRDRQAPSNYRDTTIRTQDFRASRRNYLRNDQRERDQQYREPRQPPNRPNRADYSQKPRKPAKEDQASPPASDEEEWDVGDQEREEKPEEKRSSPMHKTNKPSDSSRRSQPQAYSQQRHGKRSEGNITEKLKNISISQSKEQPRRYSSLRQRNADSPSEPARPQHYPPAPTLPPEWTKKREGQLKPNRETPTQPSPAVQSNHIQQSTPTPDRPTEPTQNEMLMASYIQQHHQQQQHQATPPPAPVSMPTAVPYSIADFSSPALELPKSDQSLLPDNASISSQMQWYETAMAYQAMLTQNVLNPTPPPTLPPLLPQQPSILSNLPNPEQVGTPGLLVGEEQKNPQAQLPLVSQAGTPDIGALGSLAFPPPLPHNFQNEFMQRNLMSERPMAPPMQVPFSHTPGLLGQQVGGVTYYANLPHSVPISGVHNMIPGNTQIGSPLRSANSAIPIRPPME